MSASPPTLELSIVIIALNEEANLSRCLSSLPQGAEIVLLDSESSDQTVAIAKSFGALVFQRSFTNFAEQKNAALAFASRRWVLAIDADEELDAALRTAILEVIQLKNPEIQAWRLQRRLVFMGRRLRYGKTCDWPIRLFLRENAYYRGSIHEEIVVTGRLKKLSQGLMWHRSYRDLSDYFVRFNRYTSASAERHMHDGGRTNFLAHILRPGLEFFSRYVLRCGFLDGYPGYTYALLSSFYAYIKYAKVLEKKNNYEC